MIVAGKFRTVLTVQRLTRTPDEHGREVEAWAVVATLRAELVEQKAADADDAAAGTRGRTVATFRIRFMDGLTVGDRIIWRGRPFDLFGVVEVFPGRLLELECEGDA